MIPLIPTLALAIFSFICSAFIVLRIVIPILPPHPLSRRVSPSEFGLPDFRSLSSADKSHIWLASLDLLALVMIVWQVIMESLGGPSGLEISGDPFAAVRVWLAMTVRPTCLLVVSAITLLHIRMGRSVSFGSKHWMLWAPTALFVITSTAVAGIVAGTGVTTFFTGLIAYASVVAILSTAAFGCLTGTLLVIKRNLAAMDDYEDSWPPVRQMEEKPRPSFATEEIDAIRDGASWITSSAGSRRGSISAWSFSTHHTSSGRPQGSHNASVPAKSSFWFRSSATNVDSVPPVPPLPLPYSPTSPTSASLGDPDPFRREAPTPLPNHPRNRLDSQTSWLTSSNGSHTVMSAWSFPPTVRDDASVHNGSTVNLHAQLLPSGTAVSRPPTPAMSSAQVLGGYGYTPNHKDTEKNLSSLATTPGTPLEISVYRAIGWLIIIWVPMGLAYPYLINVVRNGPPSAISSILLVLSFTLSSPILALNILLRSPIPIPSGLFDVRGKARSDVLRAPSPASSTATYKHSHEFKSSTCPSVTVVEGRRSGDVWVTNGDAVDGKGKVGRALAMISPRPKLSVLPPEDHDEDGLTPPVPLQMDDSSLAPSVGNTPHSETSEQFGRLRKDSKASSHFSGGDESMAYASRIMIAQRHYSALARTMVLPSGAPEKVAITGNDLLAVDKAVASGAMPSSRRVSSSHLRTRSVSSMSVNQNGRREASNISPPPSFPLPPTPPSVRAARLAKHKKSYSSGFSFGAVDDFNEIDELSAGLLPILVPGLKVGEGMKIKERNVASRGKTTRMKGKKLPLAEFGQDEFSSPEMHSTPAKSKTVTNRTRKESHKRNHLSLPSLGDAVGTYIAVPSNIEFGRRNTVFGGESIPNYLPSAQRLVSMLYPSMYLRILGPKFPHGVDTARSSVATMDMLPPSATTTLFEFGKELEDNIGPLAESTPHNTRTRRGQEEEDEVPPLPSQVSGPSRTTRGKRRSSIVYVKSDENTPPQQRPALQRSMSSLRRAVKPLMKKKTPSPPSPISENGLRPLSLLQNRDINASAGASAAAPPLNVGKRLQVKAGKSLMHLKLERSGTSKVRAALRQEEELPAVVVRPPSNVDHQAYEYRFIRE
ncbi:uncharacterized protein EV420DRAFT_1619180 [Desarmillaria tabescens]|uniref:Uncharacterized protein n=1 Tax=Armillaria tabescens TaxID=1929756 RepID=A0AA39N9Q8_ARMTA|nr:uncharacterized protein EV420DRAFT_1619180 [Desarmillaria tabescens]KAK0461650.1 hypothetical protein EV420DRAFT_1619180 [Desarmillaria tabescens]